MGTSWYDGRKVYLIRNGTNLYIHPDGIDYYEINVGHLRYSQLIFVEPGATCSWLKGVAHVGKVGGCTGIYRAGLPVGYLPCGDFKLIMPYKESAEAKFYTWGALTEGLRKGIQDSNGGTSYVPESDGVAFPLTYFRQCENLRAIMEKRRQSLEDTMVFDPLRLPPGRVSTQMPAPQGLPGRSPSPRPRPEVISQPPFLY